MGSVATPRWSPTRSCATLRARHRDGGATWMLELAGEADVATLALLRLELAQMAIMQRAALVVDVSRLVFCDVSSAELLLMARRSRPVTLVGATGTVKRVFDLLEAMQQESLRQTHAVSHTASKPLVRTLLTV